MNEHAEVTSKSVLDKAKALGILAFNSRAEAIEAAFDAGVDLKSSEPAAPLVYFEVVVSVKGGRPGRKDIHTFVLHDRGKWYWRLVSTDTV